MPTAQITTDFMETTEAGLRRMNHPITNRRLGQPVGNGSLVPPSMASEIQKEIRAASGGGRPGCIQQTAILLAALPPIGFPRKLMQQPHHARQTGDVLILAIRIDNLPSTIVGAYHEPAGITLDDLPRLLGGKANRGLESRQ
jgi:hypothetical protein